MLNISTFGKINYFKIFMSIILISCEPKKPNQMHNARFCGYFVLFECLFSNFDKIKQRLHI